MISSNKEKASAPVDQGPFGPPFKTVIVDGEFVTTNEARVSVHANVLSYGTGTFEGIRAFWNGQHEELYLAEAAAHYERFHRSAKVLGIPLNFSVDDLVVMTCELMRVNDVRADAYVRPLLFLSGDVLPVRMHDVAVRLTIAVTPLPGDYVSAEGVRCKVSSWRRAPDATTPIRAKVIGSYVGPALAKTEVVQAGYDEAIMLTMDGFVAEATTSNILMRFGDTWNTPLPTDDILEGITRRQVMELIDESTSKPVRERRIHRSELYSADEVLLCGTAATVAPVTEVDGRRVGDGRPGRETVKLRRDLRAICRRDDPRHREWTTRVYGKDLSI
jgi:branched-chain amino acid aminotransferase